MTRRLECMLDGIPLGSLDDRIRVTDIREHAPALTRSEAQPAGRGGTLLLRETRRSLSVTVCFTIRERNVSRRAVLLQRIAEWAMGTELRVTQREGQYLQVRCSALPDMISALDWTQQLSLRFTAYAVPWWQDVRLLRVPLTVGQTDAVRWYITGSAEGTPVSFRAVNLSEEACTSLTVCCGRTHMTLEGMLLQAGGLLTAAYDDGEMLSLTLTDADGDTSSAMVWRTPDSDDDLILPCGGLSDVSVTADRRVTVTLLARGRYL